MGPRARFLAGLSLCFLGCRASSPNQAETVGIRQLAVDTPAPVWVALTSVMSDARQYHAAALLDADRALVCGGRSTAGAAKDLSSCNVFAIASSDFPPTTTALGGPRTFLTLTATGNGRVFAIGGQEPIVMPSYHGEVWSFAGGSNDLTRSSQPSLLTPRSRHTSSWLPTAGALVVVGGTNGPSGMPGDELTRLDTSGNALGFTAIDPPSARTTHTATVLASGRELLVAGGRNNGVINTVRLLTVPATGAASWSELTALDSAGLADHTATLLEDGRVMLLGGSSLTTTVSNSALFYDPKNGGVPKNAPPMSVPRRDHRAALLGHKLIVTGGLTSGDVATNSVEVFDPQNEVWFELEPMKAARRNHTLTVLDDQHALVTGGIVDDISSNSAELLTIRTQGESCNSALHECLTGHCVDGVCCDTACDGACDRCDQSGKLGECQTDVSGDPVGERDCGPGLACNAGACRTHCETHDDCRSTHFCSDGNCVERLPLKSRCDATRECAGASPCVDGFCCDSACNGPCEACGESGTPGKCVPVSGVPRGSRQGCGAPSGECGLACDGRDRSACHLQPSGADCGENGCKDGVVQHLSTCDGVGNCKDTSEACAGALACDPSGVGCRQQCESSADCVDNGYKCSRDTDPAVCVFKEDVGKQCPHGDDDCSEGLVCADGFCCAEHCPDGASCGLDGHHGECRRANGESCESSVECGSDFCVLGVCCESSCDGQCETCNAKDHAGECRAQSGDPEPGRPPCAGAGDFCDQRTCDGVDRAANRSSCQGWVNAERVCATARCDGNSYIAEQRCSDGACTSGEARDCGLYACTSEGCASTCSSDEDCAAEARCEAGACKPPGPKCVGDQLTAPGAKPQSCGAYRCQEDHCLTACATSAQCVGGYACNDVDHRCVTFETTPTTPTMDMKPAADDGCQCAMPGRQRAHPLALAAALALLCCFGARRGRHKARPRAAA
jgi:hypothetical protein